MDGPQLKRIRWNRSFRIIDTVYPPISVFDDVADEEEFSALFELQKLTNPRLLDEIGNVELIPPEQRIYGPGASYIMAAFSHTNPNGSRFSDGQFGIYYAAKTQEIAISETKFHKAKFMSATKEPPQMIDMRVLNASIRGMFYNLTTQNTKLKKFLNPGSYAHSQKLGIQLKKENKDGILYPSVRGRGNCIAVFRPNRISECQHLRYLQYQWDGQKIIRVIELNEI